MKSYIGYAIEMYEKKRLYKFLGLFLKCKRFRNNAKVIDICSAAVFTCKTSRVLKMLKNYINFNYEFQGETLLLHASRNGNIHKVREIVKLIRVKK